MISVSTNTYSVAMLLICLGVVTVAIFISRSHSIARVFSGILLLVGLAGYLIMSGVVIRDTYIYFFIPTKLNLIQHRIFFSFALFNTFLFIVGLRGLCGKSISDIVAARTLLSVLIFTGFNVFIFIYLDYYILTIFKIFYYSDQLQPVDYPSLGADLLGLCMFFNILLKMRCFPKSISW